MLNQKLKDNSKPQTLINEIIKLIKIITKKTISHTTTNIIHNMSTRCVPLCKVVSHISRNESNDTVED